MNPIRETQALYRLAYNREDNDCAVRALAVACAAPYEHAHAALAFAGRYPGHGANICMILDAGLSLGYRLRLVDAAFHPRARTLRRLQSELPDIHARGVLPDGLVIVTASHALGAWRGELIDHARDRLMRINYVLGAYKTET